MNEHLELTVSLHVWVDETGNRRFTAEWLDGTAPGIGGRCGRPIDTLDEAMNAVRGFVEKETRQHDRLKRLHQ